MLRHFERAVRAFPVSLLSTAPNILKIHALSETEPPLLEAAYDQPLDFDNVLASAREFTTGDCSISFETAWDIWQYDDDWKLAPTRVILSCYGPEFAEAEGDHLRIDFGLESAFLPQRHLPNSLVMARSNIRSLLHLVAQLDGELAMKSRRLWSESGENFAERLEGHLQEDDHPD